MEGFLSDPLTIFGFVILFWLGPTLFVEFKRRRALRQIEALEVKLVAVNARNSELAKYEVVEDAEREAARITNEATKAAEAMRSEASQELAEKKAKAKEVKASAEKEAEMMVLSARTEAERLLEQATKEGKSIAGKALEAKGRASEYEARVKAFQNTIDGYGDEYLMPNDTALDQLAREWGHKEAGRELERARKRTRQLIEDGKAASSEHWKSDNRDAAARFVIDAFNGKVDSVLSKVKHNNFGKLSQEIQDAFSIVNNNGEICKNARISPPYLDARLQELKWAVATNELKLIEQQEQRAIKAAMREEEKARKEYEKAQKEAEKEARLIKKTLEEAERRLKESSDAERAQFEKEMLELKEQLAEAESKNQRAISMAEQTRQGHVYVISNVGSFGPDIFKIGMTRRLEPLDRVKELGDASVPFSFDIHAMIHAEDAPGLEKRLHERFDGKRVNKVNQRKEFFSTSISEIKDVVNEMNIEAHWTLAAEAKEYTESKALTQKDTSSSAS